MDPNWNVQRPYGQPEIPPGQPQFVRMPGQQMPPRMPGPYVGQPPVVGPMGMPTPPPPPPQPPMTGQYSFLSFSWTSYPTSVICILNLILHMYKWDTMCYAWNCSDDSENLFDYTSCGMPYHCICVSWFSCIINYFNEWVDGLYKILCILTSGELTPELERQQQQYEDWLMKHGNYLEMQVKSLEQQIGKCKRTKKAINARNRQVRVSFLFISMNKTGRYKHVHVGNIYLKFSACRCHCTCVVCGTKIFILTGRNLLIFVIVTVKLTHIFVVVSTPWIVSWIISGKENG